MNEQEVLAKLNNELYVAPIGRLYIDKFQDFVVENIIDVDAMSALELEERFRVKKQLFDYVCNTLTCLNGYGENEYTAELNSLCSRMDSVDHLVNYLKKQSRTTDALRKMDSFLTDMLVFSTKMYGKQR